MPSRNCLLPWFDKTCTYIYILGNIHDGKGGVLEKSLRIDNYKFNNTFFSIAKIDTYFSSAGNIQRFTHDIKVEGSSPASLIAGAPKE